ncbi:unnamed protein product [Onchocerca flexuosa]|uniref:Uncharacterized protein n=1 Tax=Onchocerca flexuosa TaxID=387005 RepID=A0A183HJE4_9BILA|nr:unnamed protein product [Onchocerca flexuosa]
MIHRLLDTARIDVWPKPRRSVVEDRFLNIDSEDYTRVREFNIDEKGTVVSRGDSFRLKSPTCYKRGKICHYKYEIFVYIYMLQKKISIHTKFRNLKKKFYK